VTVRFLEVAEIELDESIDWYKEQAPGLGDAFLIEVLSAVSLWADLRRGRERYSHSRRSSPAPPSRLLA